MAFSNRTFNLLIVTLLALGATEYSKVCGFPGVGAEVRSENGAVTLVCPNEPPRNFKYVTWLLQRFGQWYGLYRVSVSGYVDTYRDDLVAFTPVSHTVSDDGATLTVRGASCDDSYRYRCLRYGGVERKLLQRHDFNLTNCKERKEPALGTSSESPRSSTRATDLRGELDLEPSKVPTRDTAVESTEAPATAKRRESEPTEVPTGKIETEYRKLDCPNDNPEIFIAHSWATLFAGDGGPDVMFNVHGSGHVERAMTLEPYANVTHSVSSDGALIVHGAKCEDMHYLYRCWLWARAGYENKGYDVFWHRDCRVTALPAGVPQTAPFDVSALERELSERRAADLQGEIALESSESPTTGNRTEGEASTQYRKLDCPNDNPEIFIAHSWARPFAGDGRPDVMFNVHGSGHVERVMTREPYANVTHSVSSDGALIVHGATCEDMHLYRCWRWARAGYANKGYDVYWHQDCSVTAISAGVPETAPFDVNALERERSETRASSNPTAVYVAGTGTRKEKVARTDRIELECASANPENFIATSWYAIDGAGEPRELYRVDSSGRADRSSPREPHARLTHNVSGAGALTVHGASCREGYVYMCRRWARAGHEDESYVVLWNKDCRVVRTRDALRCASEEDRSCADCPRPANKTRELRLVCPKDNPEDFTATTWRMMRGEEQFGLFRVDYSGRVQSYKTHPEAPHLTHNVSSDGDLVVCGATCNETFSYRCERWARVGKRNEDYDFKFDLVDCKVKPEQVEPQEASEADPGKHEALEANGHELARVPFAPGLVVLAAGTLMVFLTADFAP